MIPRKLITLSDDFIPRKKNLNKNKYFKKPECKLK